MPLPNFIIIGTAKAGTTSLYNYLKQHPQVCMSNIKEPRFFSFYFEEERFKGPGADAILNNSVTALEKYQAQFRMKDGQTFIGEASPIYIASTRACFLIRKMIPEVKIIALLRQPADRAFSHYLFNRRLGIESLDCFEKALEAEPQRMVEGWGGPWYYKNRGFYYEQLKVYFDTFPSNQIRVWLFDDLKNDSSAIIKEVQKFIGMKILVPYIMGKHNVSRMPRFFRIGDLLGSGTVIRSIGRKLLPRRLHRMVRVNIDKLAYKSPKMNSDLRKKLTDEFRDDIIRLQILISRDLSQWM